MKESSRRGQKAIVGFDKSENGVLGSFIRLGHPIM